MSIKIRKLDSSTVGFQKALRAVLAFEASEDDAIERAVAQILADVKARGDAAVLDYTNRFDRLNATNVAALELPLSELEAALESLEPKRRAALEAAAARVRAYHEKQKIECGSHSWQYTESDGTVLGQKVTPLDRFIFARFEREHRMQRLLEIFSAGIEFANLDRHAGIRFGKARASAACSCSVRPLRRCVATRAGTRREWVPARRA